MKAITFARGQETAALARVRAAGNAAARRATIVHPAAQRFVPATWNGQGRVPPGFTVPYGLEHEPGNGRVAIIAEDGFAQGQPDFTSAPSKLPDDWDRGDDQAAAGRSR